VHAASDRLVFEAEDLHGGWTGLRCEAVPVRWGDRMHLLGPGDVAAFCNAVNWGDEPRQSLWELEEPTYIRKDPRTDCQFEEPMPPSGAAPELPRAAAAWIRRTPLHTLVSEILADGTCRIRQGAESGVFPMMKLRAAVAAGLPAVLVVEEVTAEDCRARVLDDPAHSSVVAGTPVWCESHGASFLR
jgi:hypothetical protein